MQNAPDSRQTTGYNSASLKILEGTSQGMKHQQLEMRETHMAAKARRRNLLIVII